MAEMTLEQFRELAATLPEGADEKKLARALGVKLPVEIKPLSEQLSETGLIAHTPKVTKRNPNPEETLYVAVPSLKLDENSGTRGFWVRASVARRIAQRILEVCDENEI